MWGDVIAFYCVNAIFPFFSFLLNEWKMYFFSTNMLSSDCLFLAVSFKNSCWGITCNIAQFHLSF